MARPWQKSKIQVPPRVRSFVPMGSYRGKKEAIQLNMEEFEAIRLLDYEGMPQVDAARMMQVSRPTLTRIYERARKKMATMLTEACELVIEGGNAMFDNSWYECSDCKSRFNTPKNQVVDCCIVCTSDNVTTM